MLLANCTKSAVHIIALTVAASVTGPDPLSGQVSDPFPDSSVVEFTIATMATLRFVRSEYRLNIARKPMKASTWRALT